MIYWTEQRWNKLLEEYLNGLIFDQLAFNILHTTFIINELSLIHDIVLKDNKKMNWQLFCHVSNHEI